MRTNELHEHSGTHSLIDEIECLLGPKVSNSPQDLNAELGTEARGESECADGRGAEVTDPACDDGPNAGRDGDSQRRQVGHVVQPSLGP